jgi:hypothetical protein
LEKEVTNGRIGHYGIASPAFLYPTSSQKIFTLKKVLATAQEVAKSLGQAQHHFLGIQVPFNLVEGNLVRDSLFQEEVTKNGLVCLSYRPLTAQLSDDTWFELASYPKRDSMYLAFLFLFILLFTLPPPSLSQ